jgi:hypothetical protein
MKANWYVKFWELVRKLTKNKIDCSKTIRLSKMKIFRYQRRKSIFLWCRCFTGLQMKRRDKRCTAYSADSNAVLDGQRTQIFELKGSQREERDVFDYAVRVPPPSCGVLGSAQSTSSISKIPQTNGLPTFILIALLCVNSHLTTLLTS